MHNMNVKGMIFTGEAGRKAIDQILKAKPVKNKFAYKIKNLVLSQELVLLQQLHLMK